MDPLPCREETALLPYVYRREIQLELLQALTAIDCKPKDCLTVVRTAARVLRISLLECSLVCWLLSHRPSLKALEEPSRGVLYFTRPRDRRVFLLLVLNGYHAKAFLSPGQTDPRCDADLLSAVPDFRTVYGGWRPAGELGGLSLGELNGLFAGRVVLRRQGARDYDSMVGNILQLSKSYNIGGNQTQPLRKKRREKEEKQEKELDSERPSMTPFYEAEEGEGEDGVEGMLKVSSERIRKRDYNLIMQGNESRAMFGSLHVSEPSLFGSGQRHQGIKPTSSFFDDV